MRATPAIGHYDTPGSPECRSELKDWVIFPPCHCFSWNLDCMEKPAMAAKLCKERCALEIDWITARAELDAARHRLDRKDPAVTPEEPAPLGDPLKAASQRVRLAK